MLHGIAQRPIQSRLKGCRSPSVPTSESSCSGWLVQWVPNMNQWPGALMEPGSQWPENTVEQKTQEPERGSAFLSVHMIQTWVPLNFRTRDSDPKHSRAICANWHSDILSAILTDMSFHISSGTPSSTPSCIHSDIHQSIWYSDWHIISHPCGIHSALSFRLAIGFGSMHA